MELTIKDKKEALRESIAHVERSRFQKEALGKAHYEIGNTQAAEACAKDVAMFAQLISSLTKQLDTLA